MINDAIKWGGKQNGDTALHIAAAMGRRKLTRILIAAGCSTNVKNKVGDRLIGIEFGITIDNYLAFCSSPFQQGEYAVDIARRKEFHEIVGMLLKSAKVSSSAAAHDRSKNGSASKSKSKRVKTDSATASSKDGSRSNSAKPKERKRVRNHHKIFSL